MDEIEIKTDQLKAIRIDRKVGRPKLAKQLGITERQLAKIEKSDTAILTTKIISRITKALQISSMTLTGEFPLIEKNFNLLKSQNAQVGAVPNNTGVPKRT